MAKPVLTSAPAPTPPPPYLSIPPPATPPMNQVEVHEQANLNRLLGCIQALREAIDRLAQAKTQTAGD